MDLSRFLNFGESDSQEENKNAAETKESSPGKEGQWREKFYKRKGFSNNTQDRRALRSVKVF